VKELAQAGPSILYRNKSATSQTPSIRAWAFASNVRVRGLIGVSMNGTLDKTTNGDAVKSSTLRVRRFRERREGGCTVLV
jgi:hypothetical protein